MVKRVSSILGPDGKPVEIDQDVLGRDIAAPTISGVRSIMSSHPAQGMDPARLATILRQAETGDASAQFDLAEEVEEKYLHYQGTLGVRKRAVAQLDVTVDAASDDQADQDQAQFIRDWLDRDTLEAEMQDIMDSLGKGVSFTEIVWRLTRDTWLPERLETRDGRWFDFDPVDGRTPRLIGGVDGEAGLPQPLPPYKFIVHTASAKTGLPLRGGLVRGVAWAWIFQNFAIKDWVIFAEVYGMPVRIGKYDANATEDQKRTLLRAVSNIGTDAAAIVPASMQIEFANAMAAGNYEIFQQLCVYLDDQVSKAVLGQTGTSDAKAGGIGSGSANVHNDVREDIQRADAKALAATLNRDLIRPMIDLNFGPPAAGVYPRLRIGKAETFGKDDLDILTGLVSLGVRVEESVARDRAGYPDPPETGKDGKPVRLLSAPGQAAPADPAKNPAVGGLPASGASGDQKTAPASLKPPYDGLKTALKAEGGDPAATLDAIDGLVDLGAQQWAEVQAPYLDEIEQALSASTSIEDFRGRLIGALEKMDTAAMTDLMARSLFSARLAGEAGLDITGQPR